MSDGTNRKYVDHPAPSIGLMTILLITVFALVAAIPAMLDMPSPDVHWTMWAVILFSLATLCFYFWPLYSTYYTVSSSGIQVRYGPWVRHHPWSDFVTAYWQKGMFATRIGWPSVTPCVRLSDGVLLKRKARRFGLYLTPNDSKAFLVKIAEFAPDLTAEMIIWPPPHLPGVPRAKDGCNQQ